MKGATDDGAAFERLFRNTRTDLLAYLLRRSPTAEEAADALAETYLIAWEKLDSIPPEQARPWLFGVARNVLRKRASGRRSNSTLVERLAFELRAGQSPVQTDERHQVVREALWALNEKDREILTLTAWEGLTPAEIATALHMSPNAVRVRLHRARARLKRQLRRLQPAVRAPGGIRGALD